MTILYRIFFTTLLTTSFLVSYSQSLVGTQSNYAGSRSLSMNPALLSTSNLYSDFCFAGLGLTFQNDFLYMKGSELSKFFFTKEHPEPSEQLYYDNPDSKSNNVYESLDLSLFSFMYSIDAKQSVGFSINGRVYTNGTEIPNEIPNIINTKLKKGDFNGHYVSSGTRIATMEWAELAFAYSRKVYERNKNRIDVGASLKYLLGYSAAAGVINNLDYEIYGDTNVRVNEFDADIAYSLPLNYDENFSDGSFFDNSLSRGNGVAIDLGLTFTRKKFADVGRKRIMASCMLPIQDYKWRFGLSLMDVGFINFNKNAVDNNFVNNTAVDFDKKIFDNLETFNDMIEFLSAIYYEGDTTASIKANDFKVGLPTTLRLQYDYCFGKNFYLNATFIQPIKLFRYSVGVAPQLLIEPRLESKYIDFSLPLTLRDYNFLMLGASLRVGFITIGTQNLASYLGFGNVGGIDLFVSVKFNFAKGRCGEDRFDACWSADYGKYKNRKRQ